MCTLVDDTETDFIKEFCNITRTVQSSRVSEPLMYRSTLSSLLARYSGQAGSSEGLRTRKLSARTTRKDL